MHSDTRCLVKNHSFSVLNLNSSFQLQAWRLEFHKNQLTWDVIGTIFGLMEHIVATFRFRTSGDKADYDEHLWTSGLLCYILGSLHVIVVGILILKYRKGTLRWRSQIIMVHVILRLIDQYFLILRTPLMYMVQPLEVPSTAWKSFLYHISLPLVMTRISLTFPVPLDARHAIYFTNMAIFFKNNLYRCPEEVAAMPGQGQWYHQMVVSIEKAMYNWFPFPAFRRDAGGALISNALSETGSCLVFKSWVEVSENNLSLNLRKQKEYVAMGD